MRETTEHTVLTCEEAATYLRLHPRTVGRMLQEGRFPGVKVGRQWRIRRADLETFLTHNGKPLPTTSEST
jgi:excisionase family DNA binding protein